MYDEQNQSSMPEQIRKKIAAALRDACAETGSFQVKFITPKLLTPMGINWRFFASPGEKLGEWLDRNYPEFERSEDGSVIFLREISAQGIIGRRMSNEVRVKIADILNAALEIEPSVLLSDLGTMLQNAGIDRRNYTSEGLANWMISMFPELSKSNDGLRLCRGNADHQGPVTVASSLPYPPVNQYLSMIDLDEDIRQMHSLAFMGWWSNNVRNLKELTGCTGNDNRIWSGIIAQRMADVFLGKGNFACKEMDDGNCRIAFYTGMDTVAGKPIYCVLMRNKLSNAKFQPLMLEAFTWPGNEENPEITEWLNDQFSESSSVSAKEVPADISRLEAQCTRMEELRQQLRSQVQSLLQLLDEGSEIQIPIEANLEEYRRVWQEVRDLRVSMDVPQSLIIGTDILNWCAEQNPFAIRLAQLEQSFETMQTDLEQILEKKGHSNQAQSEDRIKLHQACEAYPEGMLADALDETLLPYRQILNIMDVMSFNQDPMKLLTVSEQLNQHFGFNPMLIVGMKQKCAEDYQMFHLGMDKIDAQLRMLEELAHPKPVVSQEYRTLPTARELLDAIREKQITTLLMAGGARNKLEELILEDRLPEAQNLAGDSQIMENAGYSAHYQQQILLRLSNEQLLPQGHTIYNAGRRINLVMGDENETAERYLLMGLLTEREECSTELLRIYRQTNQWEKFQLLWSIFGSTAKYDAENYKYYIRKLQGVAPDKIRAYLDSLVFLYYLPEYAPVIAAVCPEIEIPEGIQQEPYQMNVLECALVANDHSRVLELLDNRQILEDMGYDPNQITQISQAAISDHCPNGTLFSQIGMRIYLYQGNFHRLAEYYLWQGMAQEQNTDSNDCLLRLLSEEQRWAECIRLYNSYASESGISTESRQAYLKALLHAEPIRAQQFIRNNLQDFLGLAYQHPDTREMIYSYRDSINESFREFYQNVYELIGLLEEDFPRSVILHNRNLRNMVTTPDAMSELGLDDRQIESARTLYQSGSYPQGTDAISVARRVFAFLGNYHGIAEKLAIFALPNEDALELLWTIYQTSDDTQAQNLLLQKYPTLRNSHSEEYGQYLFDTAQYERFLSWAQEHEFTLTQQIQQTIARLLLDPKVDIQQTCLTAPASKEHIANLTSLAITLDKLDRREELEGLLFDNFDVLLQDSSPAELKRIMTVDGALTYEWVEALQKRALEEGQIPTALYYYNTLQIGELSSEAEVYYAQCMDARADSSSEEWMNQLNRLSKLYPNQSEELNRQIYFLRIQHLLKNESASVENAALLAQMLDQCKLDADGIRQIISAVRDSSYGGNALVVQKIMNLTTRNDLYNDGLLYLHQVAITISRTSVLEEPLCDIVSQQYLNRLNHQIFPEELVPEAEMLCRRILRSNNKQYQIVLCLYRIEQMLNQNHKAEYALRYLFMQPVNALGNHLYAIVEAAAEEMWKGTLPSALSLFQNVLQQETPEHILSYCQFCSLFSEASNEDVAVMHDKTQALRHRNLDRDLGDFSECTETECESLVKVLCMAPDKADFWSVCAAMQNWSPKIRGKLLFNCGTFNPNIWQECVQHCVKFELHDITLQALEKWCNSPASGQRSCRTYLANLLEEDPGFFDRWTNLENERSLLNILETLCADLGSNIKSLTNTVAHTALNAVACIAVGMGSEEAMELLERYLAEELLNTYSEVGVATVLRLLQKDRCICARNLLNNLGQNVGPLACRELVNQLDAMDSDQLSAWAKRTDTQLLIPMLLPNGNRPAAQDIQLFTMEMIQKGQIREGTQVVNMLLSIFPGDYACYDALFILCKCDKEASIPLLHKSLCGLISGAASGSSYYRRDFVWNAKLLAGVNAIIKAKHLEGAVQELEMDYQFDQQAGNYCMQKKPETTVNVVKTINTIQRNLTSGLENLTAYELDHKCRRILCWVTGDWSDFLYDAWKGRMNEWDVSAIADPLKEDFGLESLGFCRSLLIVLKRLDQTQREQFLNWILLALTGSAENHRPNPWELRGKLRHVWLAMDMLKADVLDKLKDMPLNIPYEEYSLIPAIFKNKIAPLIGKNPEALYYQLWMLGAIVDYHVMMYFQFVNSAKSAFRAGDDHTAAAYYEAMLRLLSCGVFHFDSMRRDQFHSTNAEYEAYSRISRLMLGDHEIIAKVSNLKFHHWSCINLTVALLCTVRGNQAMQLTTYFTGHNIRLSRAIIKGINPYISDQEKMNSLTSFPESPAKAFLAYLMSLGSKIGNNFRSYFFKDTNISREVRSLSRTLAQQHPKYFSWNAEKHNYRCNKCLIMTLSPAQINPVSFNQLPITERRFIDEEPKNVTICPNVPELTLPTFARSLAPLERTEDLEDLEEEYGRLPRLRNRYQERLELSERIFRMNLSSGKDPIRILPALINFGMDYYAYYIDLNSTEDLMRTFQSAMELVSYTDSVRNRVSNEGKLKIADAVKLLENSIENTILYNLLDKGHNSIHSLVDLFARNRNVFSLMQQMVQADEFRKETVNTIYTALDLLKACYSDNPDNHVVLREGLVKAQGTIGTISYGPWQPLKNKINGLIQNEINAMDCAPMLSLQILNVDKNPRSDYLYGEVRNDGLRTAQDITIQVIYENSSSERYRLSSLEPKEHNSFKIAYSVPENVDSLEFSINWSYVFNGKVHVLPAEKRTLPICEVPKPTFPVGQYETQTITDFYEDENGNISNPDFFGREKETEQLRNLFRSGRFPSYNNAIVYGIRRAGKTTLLNYVKKFVSIHCDDAIIVKVDCLNNASTRLVQSLFIDRVLKAIQGDYPQYKQSDAWSQLCADWKLPADSSIDRDPEDLELFYQELKQITGKGLVLMLDEVDNFFTAVERQTSLDSHLFQVLSNMLCSASSQESVHFIFCGSKYLLRYRTGDGGLSQLFQRFGTNVIEVGLITRSEMCEMLNQPYKLYPEVKYTDEAINWIWEYTQGLVWHVKLLANSVMQDVRKNGRSIVYPVDVKDNIRKIVQKEYCEQFFDGVNEEEKDRHERLVIDAMQSMAHNRTRYVPRNDLLKLLTHEGLPVGYRMTSNQIDNAIDNLIRLKLVVYSEAEDGYRFPVDLYRLYFRTQREYRFVFKKMVETEPSFSRV